MRWSAFLLVLALASGCAGRTGAPAPDGDFHTAVTHHLGVTRLDRAPLRVVTLGPADLDAALALGVRPVGVGLPLSDQLPSWQRRPGWHPETLRPGDDGYSVEAIAALHPDLILAGSDFYVDREYDRLSRIAPTTAFDTAPDEDQWQTTTRQVGRILGRPGAAEELVQRTEQRLRDTAAAHPQLVGKRVAVTLAHGPGTLGVVRSPRDVSVRTLGELGVRLDPGVARLPGSGFSAQLGMEGLGVVDTDLLVTSYSSPALQSGLESSPVFRNLGVVRRGSYVPCTGEPWVALREPGVLSIPYLVDAFVPRLADAAARA